MATLTNTQISVTYVGLLKTSGNTILDSTPQQITDGSGNNSQLFLSTTKVGVGATPSGSDTLQITGTSSFSSHVTLADNAELRIGTSTDLKLFHDGFDTYLQNETGNLTIRNKADDKDIIFQSDDGSGGVETYFLLDGSANSDGNPRTIFPDNAILALGTSQDFTMQHNATNTELVNVTGNLNIKNSATDGDISFFSDDGSGGVTEYVRIDGGAQKTLFFEKTEHQDSVKGQFGNSGDFNIFHNGTNTFLENDTGDLYIRNNADDKDIIFQSDDGSGGVTSYFELDGSDVITKFRKNLYLLDNVGLKIGNSFDLDIKHDGSDSFIANATGHLYIKNTADDKDIIFESDDGSGGTTEYFRVDGGDERTIASKPFRFIDTIAAEFGTGLDMQIFHSGGEATISNSTGNLRLLQQQDNGDIQFFSDDGSGGMTEYFRVDGGTTSIIASKNVELLDNVELKIGTGNDLNIRHSGTESFIQNQTGNLTIQNLTDDGDIIFKCDDGSGGLTTYFMLDGSIGGGGGQVFTRFPDQSTIAIGTGSDLQIRHDGTNSIFENSTGDLRIIQKADDSDIKFLSDDGSGGTTEYFRLDGGSEDRKSVV